MTIQATKVYPHGLATVMKDGREIVVENAMFVETYGGIIEGAPTPQRDAQRLEGWVATIRSQWGERATHVVEPERVEIQHGPRVIARMPAICCAAWLNSNPVRDLGAASELVLIWWTETLDLPIGRQVELALTTVDWEKVARDFDY